MISFSLRAHILHDPMTKKITSLVFTPGHHCLVWLENKYKEAKTFISALYLKHGWVGQSYVIMWLVLALFMCAYKNYGSMKMQVQVLQIRDMRTLVLFYAV